VRTWIGQDVTTIDEAIKIWRETRTPGFSLPSAQAVHALIAACGPARLRKLVDHHAIGLPTRTSGVPDLFLYALDETERVRAVRFVEVKKPKEPVSKALRVPELHSSRRVIALPLRWPIDLGNDGWRMLVQKRVNRGNGSHECRRQRSKVFSPMDLHYRHPRRRETLRHSATTLGFHRDGDIESCQHLDQRVDAEELHAAACQVAHTWLRYAQGFRRSFLRQALLVDHFTQLTHEIGANQQMCRFLSRETKIREYVS